MALQAVADAGADNSNEMSGAIGVGDPRLVAPSLEGEELAMSIHATPGQKVFLAVFVLLLMGGSASVVLRATKPKPRSAAARAVPSSAPSLPRLVATPSPSRSRETSQGGSERDVDFSAFLAEGPEAYRVISERNLFQPLVQPRQEEAPPPRQPARVELPPMPAPVIGHVVQEEKKPEEPPPPPPPPPPVEFPSQPPSPPPGVPIEQVAATGFVQRDGEWMVILENLQTKEVRFAYVGEKHWGYEVREVDPVRRQAVLKGGETLYPLRIGQNKKPQEIKAPTPTTPSPSQSQQQQRGPGVGPPPFGGFFGGPGQGGTPPSAEEILQRIRERFGSVSPEMEQRIRERFGPGGGSGRSSSDGGRFGRGGR